MIDYTKFTLSLKALEQQFENYKNKTSPHHAPIDLLDREALIESIIQRFETCYDCAWKHLKRYLIEAIGLGEIPNSPKAILRLANENQLLASSLEQWFRYADARTNTAHDYSQEKALDCLALMQDFIDDAIGLHQTMVGETWE